MQLLMCFTLSTDKFDKASVSDTPLIRQKS